MAVTSGQRRLTVVLSADVNDFVRGLATAQKALQSASRSMIAIGQNLAFGIGAPLTAISARLIKMGADFETAGAKIVVQTQLSSQAVEQLKSDVAKLSDSLKVTQSKAELMAGGLAVAGAGFSEAAQVTDTLTKAAQLSSLGLGEMDTVARSLTSVLTAFAPQGVNAAEAANAFLLAVQEGGFPAEQFANSVARLGSVAVQTDVSLQELIASLAVYTRATGDADEATTGITRILSDIAAPSEKARKAWLDVFPVEGVLKARRLIAEDMIGFLVTLARKMKEVPIEVFQELVSVFFDNERAARAFMNIFGAQGDAVIKSLKNIVTNTTALPKALNEMLTTWTHVFNIMRKMVDDLSTDMGEKLLPTVRNIASEIAGWAFAVRPLLTANAGLLVTIAAITAGSIALLVVIGQVGLGISALMGVFTTLGTVLVGVGSAIASVVASLLAVAGPAIIGGGVATALVAPWLALIATLGTVIVWLELWSDESTTIAKGSASNWVKLWTAAILAIKTAFRGMLVFMAQEMVDFFKAGLAHGRERQNVFGMEFDPIMIGGKTPAEWMFGPMINDWQLWIDKGKGILKEGAGDLKTLTEQMMFGFKPLDQKFPSLKLPDIIVPGAEIAKLQQMSSESRTLAENLLALKGLKIQVFDVDTKELRAATIDELMEIQREAGAIAPISPGIFSFEDMFDRLALFKARLKEPFDLIPGFATDFKNLLKNLGVAMGDFKLPIDPKDAEKAKKIAKGLGDINEMLFKQASELFALEHGWTEFDLATEEGVAKIEEIGLAIELPIELIRNFQTAWRGLRKTMDERSRGLESMKQMGEVLKEARLKLAELTTGWDANKKAMHDALQVFESVDLTSLTDAQIKEMQRMKLAIFDTYAAIERKNKEIRIDLEETFLGAFDSIIRGVLQGTQTWRDVLDSFADIGISLFLDMFKQWIAAKFEFEDIVIPNFSKTIPKSMDPMIEKMQSVNEVFAAMSKENLADILAGAEPAPGELPLPVPVGSEFKGPGVQEIEGLKEETDSFFGKLGNWISDGWDKLTGQIPAEVKFPERKPILQAELEPLPPVDIPVVANPIKPVAVDVPVTAQPMPKSIALDVPVTASPIETITVDVPVLHEPIPPLKVDVPVQSMPIEPLIVDIPIEARLPLDPVVVDPTFNVAPIQPIPVDVPVVVPPLVDIPVTAQPVPSSLSVDVPILLMPLQPIPVDVPVVARDIPDVLVDVPVTAQPVPSSITVDVPVLLAPIEPIEPVIPIRPDEELEEADRSAASGIGGLAGSLEDLNSVTTDLEDSMLPVTEGFYSFLDIFGGLGGALQDAGTSIGSFFTDLFSEDTLKTIGDKIGGWFKQVFESDLVQSIMNFADSAIGAIGGIISAISMLAGGGGKTKGAKAMRIIGIIGGIAGAIGGAIGGINTAIGGISSAIASLVPPTTTVSTQLPGQYTPGPLPGHQHGGIAKRPTFGVFGEKGPEALVPLSKMGDFMSAPETNVVVNSPHPATVRQTESPDERRIEVIIDDAIAKSFRTGGKASQSAERTFGLRRQGGTR